MTIKAIFKQFVRAPETSVRATMLELYNRLSLQPPGEFAAAQKAANCTKEWLSSPKDIHRQTGRTTALIIRAIARAVMSNASDVEIVVTGTEGRNVHRLFRITKAYLTRLRLSIPVHVATARQGAAIYLEDHTSFAEIRW